MFCRVCVGCYRCVSVTGPENLIVPDDSDLFLHDPRFFSSNNTIQNTSKNLRFNRPRLCRVGPIIGILVVFDGRIRTSLYRGLRVCVVGRPLYSDLTAAYRRSTLSPERASQRLGQLHDIMISGLRATSVAENRMFGSSIYAAVGQGILSFSDTSELRWGQNVYRDKTFPTYSSVRVCFVTS